MSQAPETGSEQRGNGDATRDEMPAETREVAVAISKLRNLRKQFRREWPKNAQLVVKAHMVGLFKLIDGKEELTVECFTAVRDATSVFLEFLEEEKRYIEAAVSGEAGGPRREDRKLC
jgi:hypothetical protein